VSLYKPIPLVARSDGHHGSHISCHLPPARVHTGVVIVFLSERSVIARFSPSHLPLDEWWFLGEQQLGTGPLLAGLPRSSRLGGLLLGLALGVDAVIIVRRCQGSGRAGIDGVLRGGFYADGQGADGAGVIEGFRARDAGVVAIVVVVETVVVVRFGDTTAAALSHDAQRGRKRLLDDRLLLSRSGLALWGLGGRSPGGKTRGDDGSIFGRFRDGEQVFSAVEEFHHGIEGMPSLDGLYYWFGCCFWFALGLFCVAEGGETDEHSRHDCCVCGVVICSDAFESSLCNVVMGFNSA